MCDSFKRYDHSLIFPFLQCEEVFSVTTLHLITALIKIMKWCLPAGMRQSHTLPAIIRICILSHLLFIGFMKFPSIIPVNAFFHRPFHFL